MAPKEDRAYEVTFCTGVKAWAEEIFAGAGTSYFQKVEIAESKGIGRKRSDLLKTRFAELSESRTGDHAKASEIVGLLFRWLAAGRK